MGKLPFEVKSQISCDNCLYAETIIQKDIYCSKKQSIIKLKKACGQGLPKKLKTQKSSSFSKSLKEK